MCFCFLCTFCSDSQNIIKNWALVHKYLVDYYSGKNVVHVISIDMEMLPINRGVKIPEIFRKKIDFIHEYSAESNLSTFPTISIQNLLENVRILLKNGYREDFISCFDDLLSNETSPLVDNYKPIFPDSIFKEFLDLVRLVKNKYLIVEVDSDGYLKDILKEAEEAVGKEDLVVWKPEY